MDICAFFKATPVAALIEYNCASCWPVTSCKGEGYGELVAENELLDKEFVDEFDEGDADDRA